MRKSAHRKHRDKTVLGIISNKRNDFQSIYIGQANLKQDYIRRMLRNLANCTRPRMSNLGLKTCEFKLLAQGSRLPLLVVNYENGFQYLCTHTKTMLNIRTTWTFLSYFNCSFAVEQIHALVM